MWQRRFYSPTSVQNGAVQLLVDRTFSVCRLPFVWTNLFHTVISISTQSMNGKAVKAHLFSTTMYFWDSNEQQLVYMFTLAD